MKRTRHPSKDTNKDFSVLACDPSIRGFGYAVLSPAGEVLEKGCIRTESEAKKRRIRKGDDLTRRVSEINQVLIAVINRNNVKFIVSELPHGSQSATAAVMVGCSAGIVQTLSDCLNLGIDWYSEGDAKNCALGKRSASKGEMITRMDEIYDVEWDNTKYIDEAVADALAIHFVASKESSTLKFLKIQ